jgi:hypothetical protein
MDQSIDIQFGASTGDVAPDLREMVGSIHSVRDAVDALQDFLKGLREGFREAFDNPGERGAQETLERLQQEARELRGELERTQREMRDTASAGGGLGEALGGVKRLAAGLFVGMGVVEIGRQIIQTGSEFERLKGVLETLEPAQGVAAARFEDLRKIAATTPFALAEVVTAFSQLKAMGLDPSSAAITSYGNTASAMGKSLDQMIEAVADAATGEFERLKEFGIKSRQEGDSVTFTFQGVSTTVGKSSHEIQEYLRGIGDVNFAGAMERQSATFGGIMSNLMDSVSNTANAIAQGGLLDALKDIGQELTAATGPTEEWAGILGGVLGTVVREVWGIIKGFGEAFSQIMRTVTDVMRQTTGSTASDGEIWKQTIREIQQIIVVLGSVVQGVFALIGGIVSATVQTFVSAASAIDKAMSFDFSGAINEVKRWSGETIDTATRTYSEIERIARDGKRRFDLVATEERDKKDDKGVDLPGYTPPPAQASSGGGNRSGGAGAANDRVQVWNDELQRMRMLSDEFFRDTTEQDLSFWQSKLQKTTAGSRDWYEVQERIYGLTKTLAGQRYQEEVAQLDFQIQSARGSFIQQAELEQQKVELVRRTYGEQSAQYRNALREQQRMAEQHEEELRRIRQQGIQQRQQLDMQTAQTDLQIQQEAFRQLSSAVEAQVQAGLMGRREAAAQRAEIALAQFELERQTEERLHTIRTQSLREQMQMEGVRPNEMARISAQIEQQEQAHLQRMRLMSAQQVNLVQSNNMAAANATREVWMSRLAPVTQALTGMVNGFLTGTTSIRQAMLNMGSQILQQLNGWILQWVTQHVVGEQTATAATAAGAAARTAATSTAAAAQQAVTATTATTEITTNAAVAGSGALASVSKIPVIGPFIAPAIAAGIMALAMGFVSKIASAEGGWDQVPHDGAMTELHKDEMVLPASIATPLRDALASSGSNWGLGTTGMAAAAAQGGLPSAGISPAEVPSTIVENYAIHLNAMDSRSGARWLMENKHSLARALKQARRENAS